MPIADTARNVAHDYFLPLIAHYRCLTRTTRATYTLSLVMQALEWLGGFYAFIGGWVLLSYAGHRIADRFER